MEILVRNIVLRETDRDRLWRRGFVEQVSFKMSVKSGREMVGETRNDLSIHCQISLHCRCYF